MKPLDLGWTRYDCEETLAWALLHANGSYQRGLLLGREALSGSTLRGKAKQYASRYHASARALVERLESEGFAVSEARVAHGKRVLVVGKGRNSW